MPGTVAQKLQSKLRSKISALTLVKQNGAFSAMYCLLDRVNFTIILLAAFAPVDLHRSFWRKAQSLI